MDHTSLAAELIKNPVLKTSWSRETLAVWLRDQCKCVYCGKYALESYDMAYHGASVDHLLPRSDYRELENTEWNQVLACRACNCIKRDWDPNKNDDGTLVYVSGRETISDEQRSGLIRRAREYIQKTRAIRQKHFESERDLILNSVSTSQTA
jgi:HNH endonuclease